MATPAPNRTAWVNKASLFFSTIGKGDEMIGSEHWGESAPAHLRFDMDRLNGDPFHWPVDDEDVD
jgi:hypothetical protein